MRRTVLLILPALFGLTSPLHAQSPKTDALGDPLPSGALARLGTLRWRAGSSVVMAAYRPDGKTLVTVGQDFVVQVWDAATGREVQRFDVSGHHTIGGATGRMVLSANNAGAALSGDGKTLACSSREGVVRIWDVDSGKEKRQISEVSRSGLNRTALSHDGNMLAFANYPMAVNLYDTRTGTRIREIGMNSTGATRFLPYRVEFGPDAKTLFLAGIEIGGAPQTPLLAVWDTATGKELKRIDKVQNNNLRNVTYKSAVSADLKTAALPYPDEIVLYDMGAAKELRKIKYNADYRTNLAFTPDGKTLLAVTGKADALAAWDVATGDLLRQVGTPPPAAAAAGVAGVAVNIRTMAGLAVSPDGKTIALMDGPSIVPVDTVTGKPKNAEFGHSSAIEEAQFTRDGKAVLTRAADNSILRWDPDAGKVVSSVSIPGLKTPASFILPSPDGKWAATGESAGTIRVFDLATGNEAYTLSSEGYGMTVGFSPDSRTLAVVSRTSAAAQIYETASGQKRADLSLPPGPPMDPRINAVVRYQNRRLLFSPDSRLVGVGSEGHLTVWDVATGAKVRVFPLPEGQVLRHAAIAPNGAAVAVEFADGETALLEVATAARRTTLLPGTPAPANNPNVMIARIAGDPNAFTMSLAYSPDGRLLARASDDGKVRLWDARTGKEMGAFDGHRGALLSTAFSPDGTRLVTAGTDTTAMVWDLAPVRANLKLPAEQLDAKALEGHWQALDDADAARAHEAILALAADPARGVPLLKSRVKPVEAPDPDHLERLVADLNDAKFLVREKARKELEQMADLAAPALRDAVQKGASPQVRRLVQKMLELLDNRTYTGDQLQLLRAVEVLELAGTPEAIAVLKELAAGAPEAAPTPQAKAAVERLTK